ncbi:MAG: ChrR family anti-sigma-E factor [Rhizobiaceae bacterium]
MGTESLDGLLARFVAGKLPEPARVLVEAHLAISPANRPLVNALETLAGKAIEAIEPIDISRRDERLAAIFSAPQLKVAPSSASTKSLLPPALLKLVGHDIDDIPWRTKMPGYREFSLGEIDGCEANMLWIKAGRKMPSHTHDGAELTLVLDGAFSDVNGRYGRGDIALADEDVDHRPIAEEGRACICFAVTDAPLRLTGSYSQMFSDFLGR